MFEIGFTFEEHGITQKSVQRKIKNQAIKATLEAVGLEWHRRFLPEHFKPGAGAKYGYRSRQQKWDKRKEREVGFIIDLVFRGDMRDMMVNFARVSGTSKRVRVVMQGPSYVYYHNKAREAVKIVPSEESELVKFADKFFQDAVLSIIEESRPEKTKVG